MLVGNRSERRKICHSQSGIRNGLAIEHSSFFLEGRSDGLEIGEIDEGGMHVRFAREKVVQQRPSATVKRLSRHHMIARVAGVK